MAIRSVIVLLAGAAILVPILWYASTVDVRPPQVDSFSVTQHLTGQGNVALTTSSLEIVFSEAVQHATAEAAFVIDPSVQGAFSWNGNAMVFTPRDRLPLKTAFDVRLRAGVKDLAGNAMGAGGPFAFRTVGGPTIVSTQPAASGAPVPLDATITVTFSTLMDTASVAGALEVVPATAVDLRWSGEKLSILPRQTWSPDRSYTLHIGTAATDLAGTALTAPLDLAFTTVVAGVHALRVVPADGSQGISVSTPIAVVLDRPVDPGSVGSRLLTIQPAVTGSLSVTTLQGAAGLADDSPRVLLFTPSGPLPANTTFSVSISAALQAADGTSLAVPLTWSFTTGSPSASLSNQVVFLSDRGGVMNLWAMNPDGSNQHQVSAELSAISQYAIAPDGHSFVVGDGTRLVQESADGQSRRVLTDRGDIEFDPAWSPDGSTIVFGRADAATGAGLGLWQRPASGGSAQRISVPASGASPGPVASPGGSSSSTPSAGASAAASAPLLRAPRYSPDGQRLAFLDMSGRVGILDLANQTLTSAPFHAVSPPAWLPDNGGIVLSGMQATQATGDWASGRLVAETAVPELTPAALGLAGTELGALNVVELRVGSTLVSGTLLPPRATLPVVDAAGRIACIVLDPVQTDAGIVWITQPGGINPFPIPVGDRGLARSVAFAPQAGTLVVSREGIVTPPRPAPSTGPSAAPSASSSPSATASPSPAPAAPSPVGIWLMDARTGAGQRLSPDGRLARWIP